MSLGFFSVFIFMIGMLLVWLSSSAQERLSSTCVDKTVNMGLNMVLIIGVMLLTLPIFHYTCWARCICSKGSLPYSILLSILCVLIIVIGSLVWGKIDKNESCYSKDALGYVKVLTLLPACVLVLYIGYFIWKRVGKKKSSYKYSVDLSSDESVDEEKEN